LEDITCFEEENDMKRRVLIEAMLVLVMSIIAIIEGLRLHFFKDPLTLYDFVGPGLYVFALSIGLLITGSLYLFLNYREGPKVEEVKIDKTLRRRMINIIVILAMYVFLMDIFGYFVSSAFFFLAAFRVTGVTSWKVSIIITSIVLGTFYFIFIQYCHMPFPRGIFR
jgi:hypothetical protein